MRPMMNSKAARVKDLCDAGRVEEAAAFVRAQDRIADVFGAPRHNYADDMTDIPMEGGFTCPSAHTILELVAQERADGSYRVAA